ncbi:terminase large subunit [Paenibacillus alginolyticus]|uniref:terminase large subunit n=1 Tax=Paenibacillus alginolyticus TaxID=59839 RepID=UPI001FEAE858|nr:terminase TerL endonuclease subunit [Paenibacillus frigoriresistens]
MTTSINMTHPTTQYALDVVEGRIVAGKYVILSCERHLRDLERQGTSEFQYVFDEEKANKVFDFASKYCRHIEDGLSVRKGDPVILDDFLLFIVGSIFGWVHQLTRMRRFRKAYEQVARKNSKSTTLSVVSLFMFAADGEGGPQIYTAATMREQAKVVYDASEKMVKSSKKLKTKINTRVNKMLHKTNGGKMLPLSKETKSMDGFNPHAGIIDEYHAHPTSDMYDVLVSGMGMRRQPLLFIITTAGFDINGPCFKEYEYCCKVLEGEFTNEEYFVYIAQMDKDDDIEDERNWIKCNPLLARTEEGIQYLRSELQVAQDQPEKRRGVYTKNFNIWLDQRDNGYMDMAKWRACGATDDNPFPELKGLPCFVGMDLSKKIDLTSVTFEFPLDDGRFAVKSHSFIPEETLKAKIASDGVRYDVWVEQGWITVTEGAVVDYRKVQSYIIEQSELNKWKIEEVCFDEWSAGLISQEMADKGYNMTEIPQRVTHLSEPTKNFREEVYQNNIIHENDPVLNFAMSNAVTKPYPNDNIMLDKSKSKFRIDPVAASINSHVRAMLRPKKKKSIYKTRGVEAL